MHAPHAPLVGVPAVDPDTREQRTGPWLARNGIAPGDAFDLQWPVAVPRNT